MRVRSTAGLGQGEKRSLHVFRWSRKVCVVAKDNGMKIMVSLEFTELRTLLDLRGGGGDTYQEPAS